MDNNAKKKVHHGRNVRRLRELLDKRQDVLADALNVSQQRVSKLESQEEIDFDMLERIANALNVPVDAIESLTDENAANMVSNSFSDFKDEAEANGTQNNYNFNPMEKIVVLYERMLAEKDEKIVQLEKLLAEAKKKD